MGFHRQLDVDSSQRGKNVGLQEGDEDLEKRHCNGCRECGDRQSLERACRRQQG